MYIKKVLKLQMYGTTLFHVHNSKIFPSGHFLIAANASGVQVRPLTPKVACARTRQLLCWPVSPPDHERGAALAFLLL